MPSIYLHKSPYSLMYAFIFVSDNNQYSHFLDEDGPIWYTSLPSFVEGVPSDRRLDTFKDFSQFLSNYPNTHLFATPITHPEYFL